MLRVGFSFREKIFIVIWSRIANLKLQTKKNNTMPEINNNETKSFCACSHCGATKYCPNCMIGYKESEAFCETCGNSLTSLEEFENQDCPMCKEEKGLTSNKKVTRTSLLISDKFEELPLAGVNKIRRVSFCSCGNYTPKGAGDSTCATCGGEANVIYRTV